MFVLMPLFAIILTLTFHKSKVYFIEHLMYTIHIHSFLFLLYIFFLLMKKLLPDWTHSGLYFLLIISSIWYIYQSLRTVYKYSRLSTVFRFLLLSISYILVMVISIASVLTITIATI